MRAMMLRRVTIVLAVLALLGATPVGGVAASVPAGISPCMAMMAHDAGHDGPCDPAAPEPGMRGCVVSMAGCNVVALPGPESAVVPMLNVPAVWALGPSILGPGRTIEPNLFPPILSV